MPRSFKDSAPLVLIVVDDMLVRYVISDILTEVGFSVVEAESTALAVSSLIAHPNIQFVISDVCLSDGMNGLQLAEFISQHRPEIDVVLTSGLLNIEKFRLPSRTAFVAKPFDRSGLIKALNQISAL